MGGYSLGDPWEAVIPLEPSRSLDPFPTNCLPDVWRDWVLTTSATFQVPAELPALISLGVVSAAAAPAYSIAVDESRGWKEPLVIWTAAIAVPGSLKSRVVTQALEPLRGFMEMERQMWSDALSSANRFKSKGKDAVKKETNNTLFKLSETKDPLERKRLQLRLGFLKADNIDDFPASPEYAHEDITLEALTESRAEQGKAAVISSEAGIFNVMSGMYSNDGQANLDATLKGYDAEPFSRKRVGKADRTRKWPSCTCDYSSTYGLGATQGSAEPKGTWSTWAVRLCPL